MISIDLPDDVGQRLTALAETTGRPASIHAERAIIDYLDDLEDFAAAELESLEVEAGRSVPMPLGDVLKSYGLAD